MRQLTTNILLIFAAVFITAGLYMTFMYVPNERIMGPVQRIFYFHVASAFAAYLSVGFLFVASLKYLGQGDRSAGAVIRGSAEVLLVLTSVVLISGMIWGKSAWNTYFRWEPRLVSFLALWLVALSINIAAKVLPRHKGDQLLAILGIIATVNLPIVWLSIKLLPQAAQLHPTVIEKGGLIATSFRQTLLVTTLGVSALTAVLIAISARLHAARARLDKAKSDFISY